MTINPRSKEIYDKLVIAMNRSASICDPMEWENRQKTLLWVLTEYIITRDQPYEGDNDN